MNNEPVAYGMFKDDEFYDAIHPKQYTEHIGSYTIPLYTHPVKELTMVLDGNRVYPTVKELTDEEIKELSEQHLDMDWQMGVIEFARAILRKAQEK